MIDRNNRYQYADTQDPGGQWHRYNDITIPVSVHETRTREYFKYVLRSLMTPMRPRYAPLRHIIQRAVIRYHAKRLRMAHDTRHYMKRRHTKYCSGGDCLDCRQYLTPTGKFEQSGRKKPVREKEKATGRTLQLGQRCPLSECYQY